MSAQKKKAAALAASTRSEDAPSASLAPVSASSAASTPEAAPFYQRHPKIANALFAALCVYVAMLCLLALDQTFHWGIFGPKIPPVP